MNIVENDKEQTVITLDKGEAALVFLPDAGIKVVVPRPDGTPGTEIEIPHNVVAAFHALALLTNDHREMRDALHDEALQQYLSFMASRGWKLTKPPRVPDEPIKPY